MTDIAIQTETNHGTKAAPSSSSSSSLLFVREHDGFDTAVCQSIECRSRSINRSSAAQAATNNESGLTLPSPTIVQETHTHGAIRRGEARRGDSRGSSNSSDTDGDINSDSSKNTASTSISTSTNNSNSDGTDLVRHPEAVLHVPRPQLPQVHVVFHPPAAVLGQGLVHDVPGVHPTVEVPHRRADVPAHFFLRFFSRVCCSVGECCSVRSLMFWTLFVCLFCMIWYPVRNVL